MDALEYKLCNAPVFILDPTQEQTAYFDAQLNAMIKKCHEILREQPDISPHTIVDCHFAGMSIAECCLLWIKLDVTRRRLLVFKYNSLKKQTLTEHQKQTIQSYLSCHSNLLPHTDNIQLLIENLTKL